MFSARLHKQAWHGGPSNDRSYWSTWTVTKRPFVIAEGVTGDLVRHWAAQSDELRVDVANLATRAEDNNRSSGVLLKSRLSRVQLAAAYSSISVMTLTEWVSGSRRGFVVGLLLLAITGLTHHLAGYTPKFGMGWLMDCAITAGMVLFVFQAAGR